MEQSPKNTPPSIRKNEAMPLTAKLLFRRFPEVKIPALHTELGLQFDAFDLATDEEYMKLYAFEAYKTVLPKGSETPGMTVLFPEMAGVNVPESAITQAWYWPEAKEVVDSCTYEVSVIDYLSDQLDHMNRLHLFNSFMMAIVRGMQPVAVYFPGADKVVNAPDFLQELGGPHPHILSAVSNFRIFRPEVPGVPFRVDTLGLHSLGLTDFELVVPEGRMPELYANAIWQLCYMVYQNGDFILDDQLYPGSGGEKNLKAIRKKALDGPERVVIGLIPI